MGTAVEEYVRGAVGFNREIELDFLEMGDIEQPNLIESEKDN